MKIICKHFFFRVNLFGKIVCRFCFQFVFSSDLSTKLVIISKYRLSVRSRISFSNVNLKDILLTCSLAFLFLINFAYRSYELYKKKSDINFSILELNKKDKNE